jgi:hypothetical protein
MRVQKFHVYLMRKGNIQYEDVGDRIVSVPMTIATLGSMLMAPSFTLASAKRGVGTFARGHRARHLSA